MTNDIIILGAGASKTEGAPLQKELIKKFYQLINEETIFQEKTKSLKDLKSFFLNFFGIEGNEPPNFDSYPTFEEVLAIIEIALERKEYYAEYIKTNQSLNSMKRNLIFLISEVIKRSLINHNDYHNRLIQRLIREKLLDSTSFISLNYDIIIDNRLFELRYGNHRYRIDYGVDFYPDENLKEYENIVKSIKLYKLHGSLNWLYCHSCVSLKLTLRRKGASAIVDRNVPCENPNCNANYQPILIPPSYNRVISNYYLQQVWHKAETALKNAERIFVCGYSFPDADIHIKYLLKRAELYNNYGFEIYIINWHIGKSNHIHEEEKKRFQRFFRNKDKIHYTRISFQEFCEKGIYNLRY